MPRTKEQISIEIRKAHDIIDSILLEYKAQGDASPLCSNCANIMFAAQLCLGGVIAWVYHADENKFRSYLKWAQEVLVPSRKHKAAVH